MFNKAPVRFDFQILSLQRYGVAYFSNSKPTDRFGGLTVGHFLVKVHIMQKIKTKSGEVGSHARDRCELQLAKKEGL